MWLGDLTPDELRVYLEEHYDDSDDRQTPLSAFAGDLRILWYDHDFLEAEATTTPSNVRSILEPMSFSSSYIDVVARRAGDTPRQTVLLIFDYEYEPPPEPSPSKVQFLGSFDYDPRADPASG